jgi:hypothetical protein
MGVVVIVGIAVDVAEGDSSMKKDQSVATEKNRRSTVQRMDMAHRASKKKNRMGSGCMLEDSEEV